MSQGGAGRWPVTTIGTWRSDMWIRTGVVVISALVMGCNEPKGAVVEDSRTTECRQAMVEGLESLGEAMAWPFPVSTADADLLFETGRVTKEYPPGQSHRVELTFGLVVVDEDGCQLRLFKQAKVRPNNVSTNWGNYAATRIDPCRCE
jgi:hypothetical protein